MITEIKEPIDVLASFVKGHLKPSIFYWNKRRYKVSKILGSYHDSRGNFRRFFYSLQAGTSDIFEVCLNTEDMNWCLIRVHYDG